MKYIKKIKYIVFLFLSSLVICKNAYAFYKDWHFMNEENGIKIYIAYPDYNDYERVRGKKSLWLKMEKENGSPHEIIVLLRSDCKGKYYEVVTRSLDKQIVSLTPERINLSSGDDMHKFSNHLVCGLGK